MPERNEAAQLLEDGAREIRDLRRRNELLGVQVDTFNKCFAMMNAQLPQDRTGMSEDVAWKMERKARELDGPGPQPGGS